MTSKPVKLARLRADDIKRVPDDAALRQAIRSAAAQAAVALDRSRPLSREDLERYGHDVLRRLELPRTLLGFAMVAVSNEFWRPVLDTIPFHRRLFLLPHCLSDRTACTGVYDSVGLHCAGCGSCDIHTLKSEAERLGYSVIVAEGTSSVLFRVLEGDADAIVGVACLDSLERSFQRVVELGIPHVAVPLLKDGCLNTEMEIGQIRRLLAAEATPLAAPESTASRRSYVGLLRETGQMFRTPTFADLLAPYVESAEPAGHAENGRVSVQEGALHWLQEGGKRLRPFVTLAAYAVAKHGMAVLELVHKPPAAEAFPGREIPASQFSHDVLDSGNGLADQLPLSVRRVALAIEALHKASLVHDDIEDNDDYRYGRPTLHRIHGVAQTINIGDFLIGLGYRLIAGESASLGIACSGDILDRLSHAHLELCRGQGAELQCQDRRPPYRAAEVMKVAAQKTAPAFEVALYAGLRAGHAAVDPDVLRRFATYLGEGFQIRNDLDDWQEDKHNKRHRGLDVRAGRLTLLHVFAAESGHAPRLAQLTENIEHSPTDELIDQVYDLYCESGAFAKVEQLYERLRHRALAAAAEFPTADLQELMQFLVRMILQESARA
jgi:geranylgeranyl pyrophosphate synthase